MDQANSRLLDLDGSRVTGGVKEQAFARRDQASDFPEEGRDRVSASGYDASEH